MTIGADVERPSQSASAVVGDIEIFVPLAGVIDLDVERQRLEKEIVGLEKALGGLEKKLGNEAFKKNAPADVVEAERARQAEYQTTLAKLQGNLAVLAE
jgi:valyl-tRNA synthetase